MMRFVVGLGNIGRKYEETRHNAGFLFVDHLAERLGLSQKEFSEQQRLSAHVARAKRGFGEDIIFAKPTTLMNRSGQAARAVVEYYSDTPRAVLQAPKEEYRLIVAHDDLDLELGQYKLQHATGPKVHNGLNSVYQHLGTQQFWHLRIGIDTRQGDRSIPPHRYVLQKLRPKELDQLKQTFSAVVDKLLLHF